MRIKIGRALVICSLGLLFLAYFNFAPTALSSAKVADYVKNHFLREIVFGVTLALWAIPIGGGVGKQFKLFGSQFQAYGQVGYNVVRPDGASTWRAILALTAVF